MLIKVDRTHSLPLHRQIRDGVAHLIDEGSLRAGECLPPTRELARQLGLNRSTVYRAYEELWSLGYLESRAGSYSTVRAFTAGAHVQHGERVAARLGPAVHTGARQSHAHMQRLAPLTVPNNRST